jgi:transketolase
VRDAFSSALVSLAKADPNVLLLTGDHGYALFDEFRRVCPSHYINAGIAEQNMVGMAAGLARAGFRPIVYGLSAFVPVRVLEQIKLDVAHDRLPVIFIGDGAGFVYSHLGTSHQSTEDIACTRAVPDLQVYSPADAHEMSLCMHTAYQQALPVYLRMGKSDRGLVHGQRLPSPAGQALCVRPATGTVNIFATGSMVRAAIDMADSCFQGAGVWSVPFIKPIDEAQIAQICRSSCAVITLEEHSVHGGLGSLVAEISSSMAPVRVLRLGVNDRFSAHCGTYDYLLREHGLDRTALEAKIQSFLQTVV